MVTKLLLTWKFDGYVRWLRGLRYWFAYLYSCSHTFDTPGIRFQYKLRRDLFLDIISEEFDLSTSTVYSSIGAWSGCTVYTAYARPKASTLLSPVTGSNEKTRERKRMLSFVAPSSGMFLWVSVQPCL